MPTQNDKKRKKENEKVLNSPEIKKLRDRIDQSSKETTSSLYGADQNFIDRNKQDFDITTE
jgi:tRNA splicing endonuclease